MAYEKYSKTHKGYSRQLQADFRMETVIDRCDECGGRQGGVDIIDNHEDHVATLHNDSFGINRANAELFVNAPEIYEKLLEAEREIERLLCHLSKPSI